MLLSYRDLIMGGENLQTRVYGSHKGMTSVSKRMGQTTNGPIKRLGHTNSGIKKLY